MVGSVESSNYLSSCSRLNLPVSREVLIREGSSNDLYFYSGKFAEFSTGTSRPERKTIGEHRNFAAYLGGCYSTNYLGANQIASLTTVAVSPAQYAPHAAMSGRRFSSMSPRR